MSGITIESVIENSNKLTILTAKKTVISLYDYLHIKGLYLRAKIRPEDHTLSKHENVEFIVDFLDKTNLKKCPFWTALERETKLVAARFITLRDESEMTLISSSRVKDAGIFILLSGTATLVTSNKEEPGHKTAKLSIGSVFGPIDLFLAEEDRSELTTSYKGTVARGSVLQLRFQDLFRAKYGDRSVSADPNEGLTHAEICLRDAECFGQHRLSPAIYQFLRRNHLLASSERDASFKYIKSGSIGRSLPGHLLQNELLVVLDGSVRLVFGHGSGSGGGGDIKCTQAGERSATFKIQQFPLSILGHGALLQLDEKVLSSGASSSAHPPSSSGAGELDADDTSSQAGAGAGTGAGAGAGSELLGAGLATTSVASSSSQGQGQGPGQPGQGQYLQHITLQFDRPTTYLSIPLKKLKNALQGETHRVNIDVLKEVHEVGRGLARRLEQLQPLLAGAFVYHGGKQQPAQVLDDEDELVCNGDITSGDSSLAGAYGIFSKLECKLSSPE